MTGWVRAQSEIDADKSHTAHRFGDDRCYCRRMFVFLMISYTFNQYQVFLKFLSITRRVIIRPGGGEWTFAERLLTFRQAQSLFVENLVRKRSSPDYFFILAKLSRALVSDDPGASSRSIAPPFRPSPFRRASA